MDSASSPVAHLALDLAALPWLWPTAWLMALVAWLGVLGDWMEVFG